MTIGVLGLQGSVAEHGRAIESDGDIFRRVLSPEDLDKIDGLIIPGGESTTLTKLIKIKMLDEAILRKAREGLKIWGTCAGLILLSKEVKGGEIEPLGLLDITAGRNGYGTQMQSFSTTVPFRGGFEAVSFIRAPKILSCGESVTILSEYAGLPVAVCTESIMATTFHPEVTGSLGVYRYFKNTL
ncbi:MAG: pyridoxal 5'-phosphate synthase glutaminase subunit PdxT [Spirochaetales bacterium]|nr:pyridoxal 5'-phosphate synthase glutaminase subunit PdxT [Spirochaetales bacterium]